MSISATRRVRRLDELWQLQEVLQLDGPGVGLPLGLLQGVRRVLQCDIVAFNDIDSRRRCHHFLQGVDHEDADEVVAPDPDDPEELAFWEHYWQSACSLPERTGDLSGVRLTSDFYSRRQWHETPYYRESGEGPPPEFEMSTVWGRGSPDRTLRLLCVRFDGPDFGDDDRFLLELLRPHLLMAFHRAESARDRQHGTGVAALTPRQRAVLALAVQGRTNHAIGRELGIAEGTVRTHLMHVYATLGVSSRAAAAALLTAASPDLAPPG
ncbi:helix-turn-helix transcriptional regulator [uncultured Serinicoccus sp.]|uniref:helix-turn-helix transcriptional regulator n=1 Tax=uncultured Serinicoccus sp. TaxID=735514 RepID=UPI00263256C0|nr:helix-turn-helix transcriptional regulator [uncultured Serinicoccus sp.]